MNKYIRTIGNITITGLTYAIGYTHGWNALYNLRFKDVPKIDTRQGYSTSPHQSSDPHDADLALQQQFPLSFSTPIQNAV